MQKGFIKKRRRS